MCMSLTDDESNNILLYRIFSIEKPHGMRLLGLNIDLLLVKEIYY